MTEKEPLVMEAPSKHYLNKMTSAGAIAKPAAKRGSASSMFEQTNPAVHMLGVPKSCRSLKLWVCVALIAGCAVALLFLGLVLE
jgi:hypothetical protein